MGDIPVLFNPKLCVIRALQVISAEFPVSGIDDGVNATLQDFHERGKFRVSESLSDLARYNALSRTITVSSRRMEFLKHDFDRQRKALGAQACPRRLQLIDDAEWRAMFELTGVLIHEGQHAFKPIRSLFHPRRALAQDECAAFRAEQYWYKHLYVKYGERYSEAIKILARNAESDASTSLRYLGLDLKALSLLGP